MSFEALYKTATEAIERRNYDYAIELLLPRVTQEPTNIKARKLLWMAGRRRFDNSGKKASFMSGLGPQISLAIHGLMGKTNEMLVDCERYLLANPNNPVMRNKLGETAFKAGDRETAIITYESTLEIDPKNVMAMRQLGRLYKSRFDDTHERDDLVLAMKRFETILETTPTDREADSASKQFAAQLTIDDGGWTDTEGDVRDTLVRDKDEAVALESEGRMIKSEDELEKDIKKTEEAIKKDPGQARLYIRLGSLQLQKKRFKHAKEAFEKAREIEPTNTLTRARLGDVTIEFLQTRIDMIKENLKENPTDELKTELAQTEKQLSDFKVKEFRKRVAEQPTNMDVHDKLGKLLYGLGDYDGAMQMFQKSVSDPRFKMAANHMLGKCLIGKEMYDRAVGMFDRAVAGTVVMNETVKAVQYDLGETYIKMGEWKKAEEAFGKVYDSDVGYRDVSEKMELVYKKARE